MLTLYVLVSFYLLYSGTEVDGITYTPVVNTVSGQVRGQLVTLPTGQAVKKYLGIPFATAERFHPPQAPEPWTDLKDVVTTGKACPQPVTTMPMFSLRPQDMSEDCLNLNVFVPNDTQSSSALPVMVWVYGGAYVSGSNRIYDGSFISTLGDVIVVVINYRLGVLGFLSTGKNGLKGNYGMLDQVEGLKWVNNNIQRFGGDPNQVTIFGESAGGSSVALLMLSPLASGLYNNVIIQSGTAMAYWAAAYQSEAEINARSFGKIIDCNDMEAMAKCLESKNVSSLVAAATKVPYSGVPGFSPVIDGHFLPEAPVTLLEEGKFNQSNIMIGVTSDEGTVMTSAITGGNSSSLDIKNGVPRRVFQYVIKNLKQVRNQQPSTSAAILYRYTDWSNVNDPIRNRRMFVDMMSDSMFKAPAVLSASAFLKKHCPTFFYHWEYRAAMMAWGTPVPSWMGAYHGADVMFVFGFPLLSVNNSLSTDANFSRDVIKRWTNFAKTGNPNQPMNESIPWPLYSMKTQQYMSLKPTPATGSKLRADYMAFWNVFVPETLHSSGPTGAPSTCKTDTVNSGGANAGQLTNSLLLGLIVLTSFTGTTKLF